MSHQTENLLNTAQGQFKLHRFPLRARELLRAWDAADEYLLDHVAKSGPNGRILVVNDSFGALTVALHELQPVALSDSYLAQQATRHNLAVNHLSEHSVTWLNSLEQPTGCFDLVLIKAPKTLALLEDELIRLSPHFTATTQIILAGMIKTLPPSVWQLMKRLVAPTTTSLARKKARLLFAVPDLDRVIPPSPYPVYYRLENTDYVIANHANVFSRDSLDIGTRFFLQHLPLKPAVTDIVDLGCGNGVVGLIAAERHSTATIHFIDESYMAVASAKENFRRAFGEQRAATFSVTDGLTDFAPESADLILCNPPFHQQNIVGDHIAYRFFKQSRKVLRSGGELWVIGNRHLNYHVSLARLFGGCSVIAANAKFVILKTCK